MSDSINSENNFLNKVAQIIGDNIADEKFGVSELADKIGMSRSNLLRKIKKSTGLSVSLYIRKIRLERAMYILKNSSSTVSEISYQVGFGSSSYFIKCFREQYGYPPGEVGKKEEAKEEKIKHQPETKAKKIYLITVILICVSILTGYFIVDKFTFTKKNYGKSIAVLPFKNDSGDSSNVYIINGLMESILNHLQKIEDVRVISRTSVEKYRNTNKSIPEIAEELNVSYFVEGSGQKIGDRILLNIQLIDSQKDKHLWAEQYSRDSKDIFKLQKEVARKIADEIELIITPEEEARIDKIPTKNIEAYDLFLKGLDLLYDGEKESLQKAIVYFEKATDLDPEFARAYADMAMAYYYLDIFKLDKNYTSEINEYADKAMLYDAHAQQSLIAKALSYMTKKEYKAAVPYFEKALEYNPNSAFVINYLSDFYTRYVPNTEKYLEYALKGLRLNVVASDSSTVSYIYLHISNAFIQSGFIDDAEQYVNKSLKYNPDNLFSEYLRAYILYAKNGDLKKTKKLLLAAYAKDENRLDILQEIGKVCYTQRDYIEAYRYYRKFLEMKKDAKLDIYRGENIKIALVYAKMGKIEESKKLLQNYKDYIKTNPSIYQNLSQSVYAAYADKDLPTALKYLRKYIDQDDYPYWIILFLEDDPLLEDLHTSSEFKSIMKDMNMNFKKRHLKIKEKLQKEGL